MASLCSYCGPRGGSTSAATQGPGGTSTFDEPERLLDFLRFFFMKSSLLLLLLLLFCQTKYTTTQSLARTSAFDDEPAYMVKFIEMVWVVQKIGKLS